MGEDFGSNTLVGYGRLLDFGCYCSTDVNDVPSQIPGVSIKDVTIYEE